MITWLETFARAITWLNARTTPSVLRRLDRYLVQNRPLIWRSKILWVAWWCSILCVVLSGVGCWTARSTVDVWSTRDQVQLGELVRYATVVLIVVWAVLQLRVPFGELPWRRLAGLSAVNFAALILMLLPSHLVLVSSSFTSSCLLTTGQVSQLSRVVDPQLPCQPYDEDQHRRIANVVRLLGLKERKHLDLSQCGDSYIRANFEAVADGDRTPDVAYSFGERIASINDSQRFWRGAGGGLYDAYFDEWSLEILIALCGALVLTFLASPISPWRRLLGDRFNLRVSWLSVPRMRLDRYLLFKWPLIWAERLHFSVPTIGIFIASALGLDLVIGPSSTGKVRTFSKLVVGVCVGCWPLIWLSTRRTDVGLALPVRWRAVTGLALAASLSVPLILLALCTLFEDPTVPLIISGYGVLIGLWAVAFSLVRTFKTRFEAFLLAAVAPLLTSIPYALFPPAYGAVVCSFAFAVVGLGLWQTEHRSSNATNALRRSRIAALGLLVLPFLVLLVAWAAVKQALLFSAPIAVAYLTFVVLVAYLAAPYPFIRALAFAERAPKNE